MGTHDYSDHQKVVNFSVFSKVSDVVAGLLYLHTLSIEFGPD